MRNKISGGTIRALTLIGTFAALAVTSAARDTRVGMCVTTDTMSVVFAAGTPRPEMDRVLNRIRQFERTNRSFVNTNDYQADGRWTLTSYGNTGSIGTSARFGYSFVPDGTIVPNSGLGTGPSQLFGTFTSQFGSQALWKQKFRQMFDGWSNVSGITYLEVSDDGAPLHFFPGQIGRRGDLRISCISLEEPFVLAYNFFPNNGDMVINADFNWGAPAQDYRFLRNTLGHEHGHGMGLGHVMPMSETKLMEPVLTTAFDGPRNDDIQGCQFLYGDRVEDNDDIGHATQLGVASSGMTVDLLAVERPADRDWFLVEIPVGSTLTVRAEPVGEAYLVGAQGGPPPMLRDNRRINDLRISAYQSDGVTFIGSSNSAGLGFAETLGSIPRPTNGVISLKIDVSTIAEDIQRYRLVFSLDTATTTFVPNTLTVLLGTVTSGNLGSLQRSDDNRLKVQPAGRAPFEFEVTSQSTILNPSSIVFGFEGSSSSNSILRIIRLFDFQANAWVQISSAQGPMIEQTFEFPLTNPARFVSATGEMRARLFCDQNGPVLAFPWETSTDFLFWRIGQ
jgi:hypothetical protein